MFPTIAEYNQAISRDGGNAFRTLSNLTFIPSRTTPVRIFSYGSGSYAVVFKAKDNVREYAIRCFISAEKENIDRYRAIDLHLRNLNATWITKIELLEDEITIGHRSYPVIKMEWVEGQLLNSFVNQILNDNLALTNLQSEVVKVSKSLESLKIGHGDIQCGNIIVARNTEGKHIIKLIDYDGMYIPSFSSKVNLERGRMEFQHPERSKNTFDEKIDRFSFWVILTALEALKHDKTLWLEVMQGGFNTLDNLLFLGADFQSFNHSKLVNRLYALRKPSLNYYLDRLNNFCNSSPESVAVPELFDSSTHPIELSQMPEESPINETSSRLQIITSPIGAAVLTSTFQRLGTTPLFIDKDKHIGKTLIISYGTQFKQVLISPAHKIVDITFTETATIKVADSPLPGGANDHGVRMPPPPPAIPVADPEPEESSYLGLGITILVLLFISFVYIVANRGNTNSNNYSEYSEDSLMSVDTIDSVAEVPVFEEVVPEEVAEIDSTYELTEISAPSKDDFNITAQEAVEGFLGALSRNDCNSAWNITYNPTWERNGLGWFCSSEAFGGIQKVVISNIYPISESSGVASIYVEYYAEDIINGNQCVKQKLRVEKTALENQVRWMITQMTNIEQPYACELTSD